MRIPIASAQKEIILAVSRTVCRERFVICLRRDLVVQGRAGKRGSIREAGTGGVVAEYGNTNPLLKTLVEMFSARSAFNAGQRPVLVSVHLASVPTLTKNFLVKVRGQRIDILNQLINSFIIKSR